MSKQNANWDDIFTRYKASGLTQPAFCKQNNVPFNKFQYRWSKKTRGTKVGAQADSKRKSIENSFEPITISNSPVVPPVSGVIELVVHLPNQIRCEIKVDSGSNGFSTLLKQLVGLC